MDIVDKYQLLERFSEIQRDFSIISHRGHFHLDRVKDSEFYYKRSGDFLTVYDVHKNRSFSFNIIPKVNKGTKIFHLVIPE